jgi:hypothetical protein
LAYLYLSVWYGKFWLFNTFVHENGRLTLLGTLFYFDHFIGVVPMIAFFALCAAGGVALGNPISSAADRSCAKAVSFYLLGFVFLLVLLSFGASIYFAGWQRTLEYATQQIERDGILSTGGNWNQLQLSNLPMAVSVIGVGSSMGMACDAIGSREKTNSRLLGIICVVLALGSGLSLTVFTWPGADAFLNPRWLAHSIREIATYPLTALPIAFASIGVVEQYLSGCRGWIVRLRPWSVTLFASGILLLIIQLFLLRNANILAIAQKPAFAAHGLSIPYLLSAHVFEHFLDFVLIGPFTGGLYAFIRLLGSRGMLQVSRNDMSVCTESSETGL